jgi:hypothetical protein
MTAAAVLPGLARRLVVTAPSILVDSAGKAQWRRHSSTRGSPEARDCRSPRAAGVAASAPLTLVRDDQGAKRAHDGAAASRDEQPPGAVPQRSAALAGIVGERRA